MKNEFSCGYTKEYIAKLKKMQKMCIVILIIFFFLSVITNSEVRYMLWFGTAIFFLLNIFLLYAILISRNWNITIKEEKIIYTNMFGKVKETYLTDIQKVYVNKNLSVKIFLSDNSIYINAALTAPGLPEILILLKNEYSVVWEFEEDDMKEPLFKYLNSYENIPYKEAGLFNYAMEKKDLENF